MNQFFSDIIRQPDYLYQLAQFYHSPKGCEILHSLPQPSDLIITGMGASYHAALALTPMLHSQHISAIALESIDLINYSLDGLVDKSLIVFVSQSGASGEVLPVTQSSMNLIAVTNEEQSLLAQKAQWILPIKAGQNEAGVASRTYINTLATLWLLNRHWTGLWDNTEFEQINFLADSVASIIQQANLHIDQWTTHFQDVSTMIFVGHGPHAATAREASMMMAEWAKKPTLSYGIGAFRHGPIEIVEPGCGLVIFTSPGIAHQSSLNLAKELENYGAKVLIVENGIAGSASKPPKNVPQVDEYLASILNVIPAQLFTQAIASQSQVTTAFRYITKVTTNL